MIKAQYMSCYYHYINLGKATKKILHPSLHRSLFPTILMMRKYSGLMDRPGWYILSFPFPKLRINWTHKLVPDTRLYSSLPGVVVIYLRLLGKESFKASYLASPCWAESAIIKPKKGQTGQANGFVKKACSYLCMSLSICVWRCSFCTYPLVSLWVSALCFFLPLLFSFESSWICLCPRAEILCLPMAITITITSNLWE